MDDNNVTDILVNAPDKIFYESKGKLLRYDKNFDGTEHLMNFIRRIFDDGGKGINEKHPIEDIGLNDGSRANAILPPIAEGSPILCIRKFTGIKPDLNALIDTGFIKKPHADYLSESIINKKNIFIAGGTGTGKTTFLNVLSSLIPSDERIIIIEDSPELNFAKSENQVRLLTRRAFADGSGGVTMSDLIRTALRMRPDRIIVGEVRGPEASDMLWAMNTGHRGSLSTGHGNSALNMITRLGNMIRIERDVPQDIINSQIAGSLNIIVHLEKLATGIRKVNEIIEIKGYEKGDFVYETIE
jgi:pilus assembly protein CpaF